MIRSAIGKLMWVGRATVFCVGLSVILAVILGVATMAVAHTGDTKMVHLGHSNTSNAITKLVGSVAGPMLRLDNNSTGSAATALDLQVEPGKAPMTVNSSAKVANLNSDQLDGLDSTGFIQGKGNIYHGRLRLRPTGDFNNIVNVPGFGFLTGDCREAPNIDYSIQWHTTSATQEAWWFNKDGVGYDGGGTTDTLALTPHTTQDYVVLLQVGEQGRTATITATGHMAPGGACTFSAQAVAQID
jgi:hypothetical protein